MLAVLGVFFVAAKRLLPSLLIGLTLLAWLTASTLLSQERFLLKLSLYPLPNIGLLFVPIIAGIILLSKSQAFQKIVDNLSQPWLIAIQLNRVMGSIFLTLYLRGLMPAEFALPSGIGDIIVGSTAPIVAFILFARPVFGRKLAIGWNIVGFLDLALAIVLGFFTSPTSYQILALDNPNWFLFDFPLALVPTFAVPLSLLLHIFSLRVLLKKSS